jgi:hypothetical protein
MAEPEIRDETLVRLLEERGFKVTKRHDSDELAQRLETVETELRELKQRKSPEETFAAHYASALDQARSKWYTAGGQGGSDAAA